MNNLKEKRKVKVNKNKYKIVLIYMKERRLEFQIKTIQTPTNNYNKIKIISSQHNQKISIKKIILIKI